MHFFDHEFLKEQEQSMKIDLIKRGAPELPEGYRYRVHVHEVLETAIDVSVSILKKKTSKVFKYLPWFNERTVVSSTIRIQKDGFNRWTTRKPLVEEATNLYRYASDRGML